MRRYHDDGQVFTGLEFLATDVRCGLKTIHLRHLNVHQYKIDGRCFKLVQRLDPVAGCDDLVIPFIEERGRYFLVHRIVLHKENSKRR